MTLDDVDAVLLHQPRDAAGERLDDLLAPLADGVEVDGRLADGDAVGVRLADLAEHVGHAQHGLGGNAGVVQAAPADEVGLDDGGLHAELRGADGGDVAARARADDDAVVGALSHGESSLSTRPGSVWPRSVQCAGGQHEPRRRAAARSRWLRAGPGASSCAPPRPPGTAPCARIHVITSVEAVPSAMIAARSMTVPPEGCLRARRLTRTRMSSSSTPTHGRPLPADGPV